MAESQQSFENHAKLVPGYHYVITALVFFFLIMSVIRLIQGPSLETFERVLWPIALFMVAFYARVFPLGVQDRLIRLEERMRMERVLPDDLQPRIGELTTDQLIGLRFAPDEELPGLARRVLDGELSTRKSIKQAIEGWRADQQRI
jgi:uncharacterized protein DUF6526